MHGTGRVKILTIPLIELSHPVKIFSYYINLNDGGRYHIETSPLICSALLWFLYDNSPRHERVNLNERRFKYNLRFVRILHAHVVRD